MNKIADDDEKKGRTPTPADEAKIQAFVRKTPNLSDDRFHDYCEQLGVNVHKAEEIAYRMAKTMHGGAAEKSGRGTKSMSQKQLAMGAKVEKEHTSDHKAAREIASDHLAEIPDYYTRLHKMEAEAKMKKSAAFMAGARAKMAGLGNVDEFLNSADPAHDEPQDLYFRLNLSEDSRVHLLKELRGMDPGERERYLADMSARNHRLAMSTANIK